jgi:DNA-binding NtrC family response regulator
MQKVLEVVMKVAPTSAPVLILGESGVGKELVARATHAASGRNHGLFVAVNCSTLNENLLETELFGHEKDAYTGATRMRRGLFERARGAWSFWTK